MIAKINFEHRRRAQAQKLAVGGRDAGTGLFVKDDELLETRAGDAETKTFGAVAQVEAFRGWVWNSEEAFGGATKVSGAREVGPVRRSRSGCVRFNQKNAGRGRD